MQLSLITLLMVNNELIVNYTYERPYKLAYYFYKVAVYIKINQFNDMCKPPKKRPKNKRFNDICNSFFCMRQT